MFPPPPPPLPPPHPHNNPNPNPKPSTRARARASGMPGAPCAACQHTRRRCPPCILAPYFPAHLPERYKKAHRLFGRANITRTLLAIADQNDRDDAARAIIFEAEARAADPVGGAHHYLVNLHHRVLSANYELRLVQHLIQYLRRNENAVVPPPPPGPGPVSAPGDKLC